MTGFGFRVEAELPSPDGPSVGRAGVISTPHGSIQTPTFIPVGTKATVKSVLPESMSSLGAQALLANAYHLYLQPGPDIVDAHGGVAAFMNWPGPTFTDSGGFQVMSLGVGFKKVLAMETDTAAAQDVIAERHTRLAHVDDDGVDFTSHIDGTKHRFTPEFSMQVQHQLGADIMFAFDECTTLLDTREYQEASLERTRLWAQRCLAEHLSLTAQRSHRPYQALFGVIQGAQYEDLRRRAARDLGSMAFDGYGIGGALEKSRMGRIVRWVCEELPANRPRHLLGIGEPEDFFPAIESGADTFDCVAASRAGRNAAAYSDDGRFNISNARFRRSLDPVVPGCLCYTCTHYTQSYIHHLVKAKEMLANTLLTIHNEHYIVNLTARIRQSIVDGRFHEFRDEFLPRYAAKSAGLPA